MSSRLLRKIWTTSPQGMSRALLRRLGRSQPAIHQEVPEYDPDLDELERLRNAPRYVPMSTIFMDRPLKLVDACSYLSMCEEIFTKRNYEFLASSERPLIIDCGANIGISVIFFKTMYPTAQIIAFEPDTEVFDALKSNVASFELSDVELHNRAVWRSETELDFYSEGSWGGRLPKPGDKGRIVRVKTARLKDFLKQRVDLLKIDIEGAETEVLKDCAEDLRVVDHLFVEYHSHSEERQTLQDLLSVIQGAGFRYHLKEASCRKLPFIEKSIPGLDLQLDIFAFRT